MILRVGLTGSIGMGKSTTARLFAEQGCPVWDADAAVERLYGQGGAAVGPLGRAFPEIIKAGEVSRAQLKQLIANQPSALSTVEQIVHPLVVKDRRDFVDALRPGHKKNDRIVIFDIPLLYETGAETEMDVTVVTSTTPDQQRDRVMARGTMTPEEFQRILEKQMPDMEKRQKADYVVTTDTLDHARSDVLSILSALQRRIQSDRDCS